MDADSMRGKTILITGAGGFTGRHACRYFEEQGMKVVACVHRPHTEVSHGEKVVCDLLNYGDIQSILVQIQPDYVLHLAGKSSVQESWTDPITYMETNVMGTFYLLEALRNLPACRTLLVGSKLKVHLHHHASELLLAVHPYSLSKTLQQIAVISWVHWFHMPVMMAEPSNLIGPGPSTGICALIAQKLALLERGAEQEPFRLSSLEEVRDFIDVRDAVRAYRLILEHGETGRTYPIESGVLRSLGEIFEAFQQVSVVPIPLVVTNQVVSGANTSIPVDLSGIKELQWQPEIPFETSVRDIVNYFRNRLNDSEVTG